MKNLRDNDQVKTLVRPVVGNVHSRESDIAFCGTSLSCLLQGAFHNIHGEETIAALSKQARQDTYRTSDFERFSVPIARKRGERSRIFLALIITRRVSVRI